MDAVSLSKILYPELHVLDSHHLLIQSLEHPLSLSHQSLVMAVTNAADNSNYSSGDNEANIKRKIDVKALKVPKNSSNDDKINYFLLDAGFELFFYKHNNNNNNNNKHITNTTSHLSPELLLSSSSSSLGDAGTINTDGKTDVLGISSLSLTNNDSINTSCNHDTSTNTSNVNNHNCNYIHKTLRKLIYRSYIFLTKIEAKLHYCKSSPNRILPVKIPDIFMLISSLYLIFYLNSTHRQMHLQRINQFENR